MGDSFETRLFQGRDMVWQAGRAEAGKDAEGKIEDSDEELCRATHGAGGDAEVGDEPEGVGGEGGSDPGNEGI